MRGTPRIIIFVPLKMGNCPSSGIAACPADICTTNPPVIYYDTPTYTQYRCSNECNLPWVASTVAGGLIEAPLGECRLLQNPVAGTVACNNSTAWCEANTGGKFVWNTGLAWNQAVDQSCEPGLGRTVCYKQSAYTPLAQSFTTPFYLDGNANNSNGGIQAYTFTMVGSSILSLFGDFVGVLAAHLGIVVNMDQIESLNNVSMTLTCYVDNENMPGYLILGDGTGTPMNAINITIPAVQGLSPVLANILATLNQTQFPYTVGGVSFPVYFDLYDLSTMPGTGPTFSRPGTVYYISPAQDMIDTIIGLTENALPYVATLVKTYAQTYRHLVGRGYALQAESGITTYAGFGGLYLLQGPQPMMNVDFGLWNSGSNAANPVFLTGRLLTMPAPRVNTMFTQVSSIVVHPFTLAINEFALGVIVLLILVVLLALYWCRRR